ncbi:type IV pilus assembly protein PilM [Crassaminicella profunda]|uniref:type IV pilus assembly protein PilM n=1 Tax=Crassaminicella profunda TaxID=1286698 RepID=UPI001CA61CAE|nr:type IV pilus assembly protein PilM [Crassaminicella profunda]QZY56980.1 type IV pilus assembly protein PilM [Crassaminicella profunda]
MFSKNILSIDIGTYNIKMVVGKYINNTVIINDAISLHTPPNAIQDGQIIDISKLKHAINKVLKEQDFKVKKVIFTLESTSIITRELFLPYVKSQSFEQMLEYEIQQQFPMALEEYVIQYKKLEVLQEEDLKKIRVLAAALPKTIVQNYLELAKQLNLKPFALDSHSNAISKLFDKNVKINEKTNTEIVLLDKDKPYKDSQTIAILDLGYENINMNIIDNGISQFSRLLKVGGKDIDINIANVLDISLDKAEKEKKNNQNEIIKDIIRTSVDGWIEEIQRIFKFYTSRKPVNKIDKIYLLGGHANLIGISQYINDYFNIPVEKIEKISTIKIENSKINFNINLYLNASGAIIRK